jgi:hypothetical protein
VPRGLDLALGTEWSSQQSCVLVHSSFLYLHRNRGSGL